MTFLILELRPTINDGSESLHRCDKFYGLARSFDNSITTSFFTLPTLLMHVEEKMDFWSRWSDTARRAAIRPRAVAIESTRDQGTYIADELGDAGPRRFHPAQILHGLPFERDAVALVQPRGPAFLGRRQGRCPRPEDTQFLRVDPSSRPPSRHRARLSQRHVRWRERRTHATGQVPHAPSIRSAQPRRPRRDMRLDSRSSCAKNRISIMNSAGKEFSRFIYTSRTLLSRARYYHRPCSAAHARIEETGPFR